MRKFFHLFILITFSCSIYAQNYDIERYLNIRLASSPTFSPDASVYRRRQREVEYVMLDKNIDFLRRISPIAKVDKIKTPLSSSPEKTIREFPTPKPNK